MVLSCCGYTCAAAGLLKLLFISWEMLRLVKHTSGVLYSPLSSSTAPCASCSEWPFVCSCRGNFILLCTRAGGDSQRYKGWRKGMFDSG